MALRHRELAPDAPGWKTELRFDTDCPCDRQPHARSGYCPRAATYWRDALVAEPSFIVVNPTNGHAHYVYLLRGWIRIDGAESRDLAAVRYLAAIERAYPRALRADAGYAGLLQHNPFSPSCPRWRRAAKLESAWTAETSRRSTDCASGRTRKSACYAR